MKERRRSGWFAFTLAMAFALSCPLAVARADRVVLYPVRGGADPSRLDELEDRIAETIGALGHEVVAPPGGLNAELPQTSAQMSGVATAAGATYVLLAEIEPLPAQYRLHLRVGYQPTGRVEELLVTVLTAEEARRLREVLGAMLRPEGLGEDAVRLTGSFGSLQREDERRRREEEDRARLQAEEEERRRREEEERRREEEARQQEAQRREEEARRAEEERAQREHERWEARPRYGTDGGWLLALGVHGGYVAGFSSRTVTRSDGSTRQIGGGGGLFAVQARIGRCVPGTDGLEVRGGIDAVMGAVGGMHVVVGGSWQWTPLLAPLHLGFVAELGASFLFTGARDVGFFVRGGAIASWVPTPQLQIELALPEIGVVTQGPGALLVGASARIGYRFE